MMYSELKDLVSQMNKLNDEISFHKYNRDPGPKFESVEEMKEFILKVDNSYDFLFDDKEDVVTYNPEKQFIESFNYSKDDIFFFIYTFEKNDKYITYLSIKHLKEDDFINNLCGKENTDKRSAHNWFNEIKESIINNSIDTIISDLIIGAKNTIKKLEIELQELASAN